MPIRYGIIGDELWNLDTEEPVEQLTDRDAEDAEYVEELLAQAMANLEDGWPYDADISPVQ